MTTLAVPEGQLVDPNLEEVSVSPSSFHIKDQRSRPGSPYKAPPGSSQFSIQQQHAQQPLYAYPVDGAGKGVLVHQMDNPPVGSAYQSTRASAGEDQLALQLRDKEWGTKGAQPMEEDLLKQIVEIAGSNRKDIEELKAGIRKLAEEILAALLALQEEMWKDGRNDEAMLVNVRVQKVRDILAALPFPSGGAVSYHLYSRSVPIRFLQAGYYTTRTVAVPPSHRTQQQQGGASQREGGVMLSSPTWTSLVSPMPMHMHMMPLQTQTEASPKVDPSVSPVSMTARSAPSSPSAAAPPLYRHTFNVYMPHSARAAIIPPSATQPQLTTSPAPPQRPHSTFNGFLHGLIPYVLNGPFGPQVIWLRPGQPVPKGAQGPAHPSSFTVNTQPAGAQTTRPESARTKHAKRHRRLSFVEAVQEHHRRMSAAMLGKAYSRNWSDTDAYDLAADHAMSLEYEEEDEHGIRRRRHRPPSLMKKQLQLPTFHEPHLMTADMRERLPRGQRRRGGFDLYHKGKIRLPAWHNKREDYQ